MSRTTIDLDDDLLRVLRARAARERTSLSRLANTLLRRAAGESSKSGYRFHLHTVGGNGVLPGVNIDSRAELFDLLDPPSRDWVSRK